MKATSTNIISGSRRLSNRRSNRNARSCRGISLFEMLVYISVLAVILGLGYVALYRSMDASAALRHNVDDISNALRAGEDWRLDIRAATGKISLETLPDEQILHLPKVSYRFAESMILRRSGNNEWTPLLKNVKASSFISDARRNVTAWRWEVELQPRTKRISQVKPLFTFIAVPTGELSK